MNRTSTPDLDVTGVVATITLRRPEPANRLGPEDLNALVAHIATVNTRPEVLVLRLWATDECFCSDHDIVLTGEAGTARFEDMADALEQARPVTPAGMAHRRCWA